MAKKGFFTFKSKKNMPSWFVVILVWMVKCLCFTYRLKITDEYGFLDKLGQEKLILTFWHNRIIFSATLFAKQKNANCIRPLVSASRDGNYISSFAGRFGFRTIRGSSSHRGAGALLEMHHVLENNECPLLTLDGPRGPRYSIHSGATSLAIKSGAKIIPASFNYAHYWEINSWDKMQLPIPFTAINLVFGKPIEFSPDASIEESNNILCEEMMKITVDRYQHP